ncbi:MAG: 50S ribosomal protein L32, partial [Christensenellaceae bacterium]|nr:50S ribosomal protein L32 [Christensenellaceae bacterium]
MAVPRRRHSKMRARTRKANWKLSAINLTECPQCHELKLSHRVCKGR